MFAKRTLIALTATAASTAALAAPGTADAVPFTCFATLPSPAAEGWKVRHDGALNSSLVANGGLNFAEGHGQLKVEGAAYPSIPADQQVCDLTPTSISYPVRQVGGVDVSRTVTSVDGVLRHVDTLTNTTNAFKSVDVGWELRVSGSQRAVDSETGNTIVDRFDHWSVHENDGGSFPFLRWGTGDGHDPFMFSYGPVQEQWKPDVNVMPDARLDYQALPLGPGQTIRILQTSGTTSAQATSRAAALDGAKAFTGLSRAVATQVVNWGADPDGDGVPKHQDDCPAVKGNGANGCTVIVFVPPSGGAGGEQPSGNGGGGGTPAAPSGDATVPSQRGTQPAAGRDTTAPAVRLTGLGRTVRRTKLTRGSGVAARLVCSEACRVAVKVQVRRKGSRRARTVLQTRPSGLSSAARIVRIKLGRSALRRLAKQQISVVVTATDAAGNRRATAKTVKLAG